MFLLNETRSLAAVSDLFFSDYYSQYILLLFSSFLLHSFSYLYCCPFTSLFPISAAPVLFLATGTFLVTLLVPSSVYNLFVSLFYYDFYTIIFSLFILIFIILFTCLAAASLRRLYWPFFSEVSCFPALHSLGYHRLFVLLRWLFCGCYSTHNLYVSWSSSCISLFKNYAKLCFLQLPCFPLVTALRPILMFFVFAVLLVFFPFYTKHPLCR